MTKGFSTHEEVFLSLLNLPWDLAPKYLTGLISRSTFWGGNFAPQDNKTHEIVGTHERALLQERAPVARRGSKTPTVYQPLVWNR